MADQSSEPQVEINDAEDRRRYEIALDGEAAGFAEYSRRKGLVALLHTEIDDRFEGRGLGGKLVAFALDDARAESLEVLPFCPFVSGYIEKHREYESLVPVQYRGQFDL